MNHREKFAEREIAEALTERANREKRRAAYKKKWHADKQAVITVEQRAHRAALMREWRAKNKDRAREISKAGNDKYKAANPSTRKNSARKHNQKIRLFIIDFFGGKCIKCGFSDARALQLDHVNGDGYKDRGDSNQGFTLSYRYRLVKENPEIARERFQLLCANCNWIKRHENYEYNRASRINLAIQDM